MLTWTAIEEDKDEMKLRLFVDRSSVEAVSYTHLNEQRVSTYFVENGSFLKLRNIQLG